MKNTIIYVVRISFKILVVDVSPVLNGWIYIRGVCHAALCMMNRV